MRVFDYFGKTPLSDSIQKAADELKHSEEKATVVFASDGLESYEKDLRKVAEMLEKQVGVGAGQKQKLEIVLD